MSPDIQSRARAVRLVVFDVDGVLTNGTLTYGPSGEATKTFNVHDGLGIVLLRQAGFTTAILSARQSEIVRTRMLELGVHQVLQGRREKGLGLDWLLEKTGLQASQVAYIGDDVNDVPVLSRVGLATCPADARPEAKESAHLVLSAKGGEGAARELCELVLKAQGHWPPQH